MDLQTLPTVDTSKYNDAPAADTVMALMFQAMGVSGFDDHPEAKQSSTTPIDAAPLGELIN